MGSPSIPKAAKAPEAPEPVKQVEADAVKARETARTEAIRRFGVIGTDKTRGALAGIAAETKTRTLGN